jgi:hypothetical protein
VEHARELIDARLVGHMKREGRLQSFDARRSTLPTVDELRRRLGLKHVVHHRQQQARLRSKVKIDGLSADAGGATHLTETDAMEAALL